MYHEDQEQEKTSSTVFKEERNTVVFFHENAGNLGLRLNYFSMLYHEMGFNVLAFAYRGYSPSNLESASYPNEAILKNDAKIIVQYIKQNVKTEDNSIFLLGRSLGGAVAAYSASIEPKLFDGLILENTFTSISDIVDDLLTVISYFKWIVLRIGWDTNSLIKTIKMPILVIGSVEDEIVPSRHS